MPRQVFDRVKETTTTTGTGDVTTAGAATGFQTFNTAFGTGTYFYYCITDANGTAWEVGRGYLSASTTLKRSVILASSNANAAINLSAGTHTVFCTIAADLIENLNGKCVATACGMNLP